MIRFFCCFIFAATTIATAQQVPPELVGKWAIEREIPTSTISCWDDKQARAILGTQIEYTAHSFAWNHRHFDHPTVKVALVSADEFHNRRSAPSGNGSQVSFRQLGISTPRVKQVTIEHSPADIRGATTEIPGDEVWIKNRNGIVLSVCNVYFEAKRLRQ